MKNSIVMFIFCFRPEVSFFGGGKFVQKKRKEKKDDFVEAEI